MPLFSRRVRCFVEAAGLTVTGMVYRFLIAAALVIVSGTSASAQALTLQKLADYSLPGDTSRYDYLSFDPTSNRMYIAHLGQGVIHVFDIQAKSLVGTVEDVPDVHGVVEVPELGRVYATATNENTVKVIDTPSMAVCASMSAVEYP